MASYKVPQDVEADDKLLGPFTFRQFIYLLIVAGLVAIAWGLSRLFIGLVVVPLPAILLFGALALPLRKDQPMEIYLAAMVSFFLKPRQRLWDPEGVETLIEITAPKTVEVSRTKDLSQGEAEQRLSYLANIVDTGGWAIRGLSGGAAAIAGAGTTMNTDLYLEAQGATDIMDTSTSVAHNFDQMMQQSTDRLREEARQRMLQATQPQPAAQAPLQMPAAPAMGGQQTMNPLTQAMAQQMQAAAPATAYTTAPLAEPQNLQYNPYPTFHQAVIQPLDDASHQAYSDIPAPAPSSVAAPAGDTAASPVSPLATTPAKSTGSAPAETAEPSTSDNELSAGIMNLVNNPDFSIETIAREANRLEKKAKHQQDPDEVVISLR